MGINLRFLFLVFASHFSIHQSKIFGNSFDNDIGFPRSRFQMACGVYPRQRMLHHIAGNQGRFGKLLHLVASSSPVSSVIRFVGGLSRTWT